MKTTLKWKKAILGCTFKIFSNDTQIGQLKNSEFSRAAVGSLNDRKIKFITRGHLRPRTEIIDYDSNTSIGMVSYNCWYPKARIDYEGKTAHWKFSNIWETRWRIFNNRDERIDFRGYAHKGSMTSNYNNDLLLLTGLYISNYYWRLAAIIIASLSPLLIFIN